MCVIQFWSTGETGIRMGECRNEHCNGPVEVENSQYDPNPTQDDQPMLMEKHDNDGKQDAENHRNV